MTGADQADPLPPSLARRAVAELVGTLLLVATVVGSGIMADRLCGGNTGLTLLCNAVATGAGLVALIHTFGPVSGAHFNPAVTLASAATGGTPWRYVGAYVAAQLTGALLGVCLAHWMFELPAFTPSTHVRTGPSQWLAEFVATFGLLGTIFGVSRRTPSATPVAVSLFVVGAYWFTASTSFANPAVTLARAFTDTFTGIRPSDVPGFVAAQLLGAGVAATLFAWLIPARASEPPAP